MNPHSGFFPGRFPEPLRRWPARPARPGPARPGPARQSTPSMCAPPILKLPGERRICAPENILTGTAMAPEEGVAVRVWRIMYRLRPFLKARVQAGNSAPCWPAFRKQMGVTAPCQHGFFAGFGCIKGLKWLPFSITFAVERTIRNPQSAIRNPQSAIRNPQSAIRNPHFR